MNKDVKVCPFNAAHVVPSSGLQRHIIKCMKNYPKHEICPYNALHRFLKKEDFVEHILRCPDKTFSINFNAASAHGDLRPKPIHVDNAQEFNLEFENWDQ